jgi:hypothetical protein
MSCDLADKLAKAKALADKLITLVDAVKPIVELWKADSPSQENWKEIWLFTVRKILKEYHE